MIGIYSLVTTGASILATVVVGTLTVQSILVLAFILFGVLWMRALTRVRVGVRERAALCRRVDDVLDGLDDVSGGALLQAVVALQGAVRQHQSLLRKLRMRAMQSFDASKDARNYLLRVVQVFVGLYLCTCLYIIALFGTCLAN